jgi:DNA polymerase-3 subunit delta'
VSATQSNAAATTTGAVRSPGTVHADPWAGVVGQDHAVAQLQASVATPVHAYLLVGPRGSGKRAVADAFAAALLAAAADTSSDALAGDRAVELALGETHPDLIVVERVGASISAAQADEVVAQASRAPIEGGRKVLVLDEFHLIDERVAPKLLKTIEEPPPSTVLLVLADDVPPSLVTIESRCVRVELGPVSHQAIHDRLVHEGVAASVAEQVAGACGGDLRRARVLASDPQLMARRQAWHDAPDKLDGTGHRVVALVDDLLGRIDVAAAALKERQGVELAELEERVKASGERGSGRKVLEDRHKRELRRHRTDELRFGLAELARRYRDAAVASDRPAPYVEAVNAIGATAEGLVRNPNEKLQLQALLLRLPTLVS